MDLNIDTAFKVAWAGFMRIRELTYTAVEKNKPSFKDPYFTRADITFSEQDQYAMLRLKQSKTDTSHIGNLIMLAATRNFTCPVTALCSLFTLDVQPSPVPLFAINNSSFSRQYVVDRLRAKLLMMGVLSLGFSG